MDRREALKNSALLAGLTISGAAITTLFQSCAEEPRVDWQPQFFTPEQALTVSDLTEVILPKTDTPGAKDLKVDIFVDLMFKESLSPSDQEHVQKGYDAFEATCQELFGKAFPRLDAEQKVEVVKKVAAASNKFNPSIWGSAIGEQAPLDFWRRVKQFTLVGYYTSEQIGKNVLIYDPIPGDYKPCIPVDEVGNSWTL